MPEKLKPHSANLFLSTVSSEFRSYRELLTGDLKRPNLDVKVQEDFITTGGTTLAKLDEYIRRCDAVIHLIGKATGSVPEAPAVAALLKKYADLPAKLSPLADRLKLAQPGFSYTQWEAYLGIYHGRNVYIYRPVDGAPRDAGFVPDPAQEQSQADHYQRICALGRDRGQFANQERLSSAVLRDLVDILPSLEVKIDVTPTRLRHTAAVLIGRDEELTRLDAAWNDAHKNVVVIRAWGGVGKTSLVATWMAELALKNWRGAERVFDWSFYSQGTRDQGSASADLFLAEALQAFGDPDPTLGSPWDRGARLARLVGQTRTLLVLDGLEPLQHPPGPLHGKLKDPGVEALLKGLCAQNRGLCVVTTRERVDDIQQHYGKTAIDLALEHLSPAAGAALLHAAGATRAGAKEIKPDDKELKTASKEVAGHALTLQLVGQYLKLVENGDIRKRDTLRLEEADKEYKHDATKPYGHAFKAMEAYERWLDPKLTWWQRLMLFFSRSRRDQLNNDRRLIAILRLLGLFDRSASNVCLQALRAAPAIAGLTEPLVGIGARDWKLALSRLEEIRLLTVLEDGALEAHPLIREYFAQQLRDKQFPAWQAAHRRLYEHLRDTTKEGKEPTLAQLEPLYQAVWHGCQAGLQQEAFANVYLKRILKGAGRDGFYSTKTLCAFGSDLGAVSCFFDVRWSQVSLGLTADLQAWLLNAAAFRLRALGRLNEAMKAMQENLRRRVEAEDWKHAPSSASNLSELSLALGNVGAAVEFARQSVDYADRSGDADSRVINRSTLATALHQSGQTAEALAEFGESERLQREAYPADRFLYSFRGFGYCDLLLTGAERASHSAVRDPIAAGQLNECGELDCTFRDVEQRAGTALRIAEQHRWLLDVANEHLTLARATLYRSLLDGRPISSPADPASHIAQAIAGLRTAGNQDYVPRGLLTSAWTRHATGDPVGARGDLDEAWEIAERGPMPLFQADVLLYRARLFGKDKGRAYPWGSAAEDLREARRLIEKHGYGRRLPELEDAERAL